ncbi:MAG: response regulator transcription factor [Chloroflexi bacterium]|nr:response regulator transcription factor [Chloroflexota bacterium]MCI0770671.1 response regulator transcription factor [Chloroflexota bacterium]MCI0790646.1 response regulator transcription factor [Chloroflexota bacterium]MCI0795326.1 response regulator transcription factor [Chloroflexota bacterium]MCI0812293.1 response regulator transcription factor [Chloroflexota bacterium]
MVTNKGTSKIKVLIVDDQEVIREAFGMLLDSDETVDLVGVLGDGESAVQMIPVLNPNVVIMDVKMPGLNGIAAAQQIRETHPDVGIILLSAYDDSEYIREFLKDDPSGKSYLLKHTLGTMDELIRTIHDVASGRTVLDPIMVEKLTQQKGISENSPLKDLTRRELEVLSLMAKACTNATIASILYIQPRTVEHHINSIFSKLGISPENGQHARVQAVLAYLKATGQSRQETLVSP